MRFLDNILKSKGIRKRILRFFSRQINPRSFGSWCVKETEESTLEVDSSVPFTHRDPEDHVLNSFSDSFGFSYRTVGVNCYIFSRDTTTSSKMIFQILKRKLTLCGETWSCLFMVRRSLRLSTLLDLATIKGRGSVPYPFSCTMW